MSSRQVRRLVGNKMPPPEDASDEEYTPIYMQNQAKSTYSGLVISSDSDGDHSSTKTKEAGTLEEKDSSEAEASSSHTTRTPRKGALPKKTKKKKKKNRKTASLTDDIDEIERSLKEINALLGAPPPKPPLEEKVPNLPYDAVYNVQPKYLNSANELQRLFGHDDDELPHRRKTQRNVLQCRRACIVSMDNLKLVKIGLSMSVLRREGDITYFVYDHSVDYQYRLSSFFRVANIQDYNLMMPTEQVTALLIEAKIQVIDSLFRAEEYSAAGKLLERAIADLQFAAHPSFNYTNKIRLDYSYLENRPFHILVLKYIYLLSNRACHRTALELAKFLLTLDPSDPLAVLIVIDTLALRARQHRWLIDAIEYWSEERQASYLYHIVYSNALAHFHVAKSPVEVVKADGLFKDAIMRFPTVLMSLLKGAKDNLATTLASEELFSKAETDTPGGLKELIVMYATMSLTRWREPPVFEWLKRNVTELVTDYNNNAETRELVNKYGTHRMSLFRRTPQGLMRHISIIEPMADLLVEGIIPPVMRHLPCNPYPPDDTINRYDYRMPALSGVGILRALLNVGGVNHPRLVFYH